jgi:hypothetical protein
VHTKEIVARARAYEKEEDAGPAEALVSVLVDIFAGMEAEPDVDPDAVQQAWERLTRDLSVPDWLLESQALADGVDVLAANLTEAGRPDLAAALHALHEPRFEGATRSPDVSRTHLRPIDEGVAAPDDGRLWVPRGSRFAAGSPR